MYIIYHVSLFIFKADDALIIDRIRMCFSKNKITDVDTICVRHTGTCFIQKIYAPFSSLLQGKHLPFTPSPLRLNIFRLFKQPFSNFPYTFALHFRILQNFKHPSSSSPLLKLTKHTLAGGPLNFESLDISLSSL
jgi:hypothetical protein